MNKAYGAEVENLKFWKILKETCTVGKENMNIVSTAWNWHVSGKATPGWVLSFHTPIAIGWLCKIPPHIQETVGFGIFYFNAKYNIFDLGKWKCGLCKKKI